MDHLRRRAEISVTPLVQHQRNRRRVHRLVALQKRDDFRDEGLPNVLRSKRQGDKE
jgi:hypothetical protein